MSEQNLPPSRLSAWLAGWAVYRDPRILAILFLGFSSGLPLALTGQTLAARLNDEGLTLGTIGLFHAVGIPYALKFLWAPLADKLPLGWLTRRFGRRRGWMLLTQAGLMLGLVALGLAAPERNLALTALAALFVAFCSASQDIVIDAWRVEIVEERQLGASAAAIVFGYRIGMLASGAGALYLASVLPWFVTYLVMAALVLVGSATILLNPEPAPRIAAETARREAEVQLWLAHNPAFSHRLRDAIGWFYVAVIGPFREFMTRRAWLVILLFAVLYKFGDALSGSQQTVFYLQLGFSKIDVANIGKLFGFGATMAGLFLGGWLMNSTGLIRALWICGVLQVLANLTFALQAWAGADIRLLAATVAFENLAGGMGTAALVAYLSSACNRAYTATQSALLSALVAIPRTILVAPAGFLVERVGWEQFFLLATLAGLPGLALLAWLSRRQAILSAEPAGQSLRT